MNSLIAQLSPTSYHFTWLFSKYSPQHPAIRMLIVCVLPLMSETKFHTHTKTTDKIVVLCTARSLLMPVRIIHIRFSATRRAIPGGV
jgi:hypothetical protein